MKTLQTVVLTGIAAAVLATCCSCKPMCVTRENPDAGFNGSFETIRDGLPVNWQLYLPETTGGGDFDLYTDTSTAKEGKRSLKLAVRACNAGGGWRSPGLAREEGARPGETYRISFWLKNSGAMYCARIGGVSAHGGSYDTLVKSNSGIAEWQKVEETYTVPEGMNAIRFEFNVLAPGTTWIDEVELQKID